MFVYELSDCGFESCSNHLNFRYRACFEEGVPWYAVNYRVWIHSETRTWHDINIQSGMFLVTRPLRFWKHDSCFSFLRQSKKVIKANLYLNYNYFHLKLFLKLLVKSLLQCVFIDLLKGITIYQLLIKIN